MDLWSNTHYGPGVYVPPYVVLPEGATTATFAATVTRADSPAVVTPSADLGTSLASADLLVAPTAFAVSGGPLTRGTTTSLVVGIGAAPTGAVVALTSDLPGVRVPATVTVPAGAPAVAFPVAVDDSAPVDALGRITATWNGLSATNYLFVDY